ADAIAADLNSGNHVAVGFECPLFVPVPDRPEGLTSARPGGGDRARSAGAGAGSLATGLTAAGWILDRGKAEAAGTACAFLQWEPFRAAPAGLFVWEAFVSRAAKTDTHCGDAEAGARRFRDSLPDPEQRNAVVCVGRVRSLIGAAVLQTGWAK